MKDKSAQVGPNEDTDNKVPVVVHSQQHDKVSHSKLHHVKKSSNSLLPDIGSERRHRAGTADNGSVTLLAIVGAGSRVGRGLGELGGVLTKEVTIPLFDGAAECFEGHDEEDYADAGTGKHALGCYAPSFSDEAGVDRVPIPEHL